MTIKEPTIVSDQSNFNYAITGPLSHGGTLSNIPEHFTITFACTPNKTTKSDVEVNIHLDNEIIIPIYFSKECDFITTDEEYFNIIYTIYWILLLLIFFFIIAILFYYIKTNNYSFGDVIKIFIEKIVEFYDKIKVSFFLLFFCFLSFYSHLFIKSFILKEKINNYREKKTNRRNMDSLYYEENDLVNVSIKSQTLDQEKNDYNNINDNYKAKNETSSYGGL